MYHKQLINCGWNHKQANGTKRYHANGIHAKVDDKSLGRLKNNLEEAIGVYRIREIEERSRV